MTAYKVGYFVGSLSSTSINRILSKALIRVAPDDLEFSEIPIGNLPLYSQDFDDDYPPEARALKASIAAVDAILFVTPEYNRSIPGALKNAIDWASRPWGRNSFDHIPAAVIGASVGQIGTAMAQQDLRGVLSFCNARQMTSPEAYIQYSPDVFRDDGEVTNDSTREFLRAYMAEFRTYIGMVLTVLPRRQLTSVTALIQAIDPKMFYSIDDIQSSSEGIFPRTASRPRLIPLAIPRISRVA